MLWIVGEIPRILGKQNDRLPFSGTFGQWSSKDCSLVMQSEDWTGRLARVFMAWDREGKEALASLCGVCLPARKCEVSSVFYRTGLALETLQRSQSKRDKIRMVLKGCVIFCRVTLQNTLCPFGSQHCWCFLMPLCWIITGIVCSMYYTATL